MITNFDSKELEEFINRFRKDVLPNLERSTFVLVIAPDDKNADMKIAIEVGCAILLNKPLIVFKPKDRPISPRLLEVADHVIDGDLNDDRERIFTEMRDILSRETKR